MILTLNITEDYPLLKIFNQIDNLFSAYQTQTENLVGRPRLFSDLQIVKCLVYQVFNRIISYRELEWKLNFDGIAKALIGLDKVPNYSTFSIRTRNIEETIYANIYEIAILIYNPQTRISLWDSTALRASRFDKEARKGKGTRLGWFKGYKFHSICSEEGIPLSWTITTANVYDNKCIQLLEQLKVKPFMILADAAYDDSKLFEKAKELNMHLVTDVNKRKAKSLDKTKNPLRKQNILYVKEGLGKQMLRKRSKIEQLFSTLKTLYHLENPRLFSLKRYKRHIMWAIFSYICDQLVNKSEGIKTSKAPWNR